MDDPDRPAISAARLEQLLGGVRGELASGLRMPPAEDVFRRASRRRWRRRGGVTTAAALLVCTVLWGVTLLPPAEGAGAPLSAPAQGRTISPTLELPGPGLLRSPAGAERLGAGSIDEARAQLLLPTGMLPSVPGLYGPWLLEAEASVEPEPTASPPLAEGCVAALVGTSGAVRRREFDYADTDGHLALARQYLLEFDSERAATEAGALFGTATTCTSGSSGWTLEDWTSASVALRKGGPRPLAEEFTTRVVGRRVVVLMVQREDGGGGSGTGLHGEFRAAAEDLARLAPG